MSYPNTPPPEDPYGQNPQQGGQGQSGGYPAPGQQNPSGGYPPPGQQNPSGGYPAPGYQDPGQQQNPGYQDPGYQNPSGGYPPPGAQQPGGYPPPGGYQDQTGGYQAAGYPQGGYGAQQPGSATGAPPSPDERQFGLFAHLGGGLLGFIVPLIIYLIKRDESPFVRDQSAQALNFQLLILIGYVVSWVLMFVFIGAITWFLCWVAAVVFGILGGVAANKGEWYRYPFNVSWIK